MRQRLWGLVLLLGLFLPFVVQAQTVPVNSSLTIQGQLNLSAPLMHCDASTGPGAGTDSYSCNLTPAITAYVNDLCYSFTADVANTGTASINYNTVGPITITKVQGGITTVLADNDIRVGQVVHVCYDGTQMQMISQLGNVPPGSTYTFGAGVAESGGTVTTASSEADFLTSGALTCGELTQGKAQVHTTPLQYCDNAATPTLRYAAYGDAAGLATGIANGVVTEATLAAWTDVTTGNSTTGAHGLLPKLSGNAAEVLKGDGTWGTDATGAAAPGGNDGDVQYRFDASTFQGSPGLRLDADGITAERRKCVTVTADPQPMTARCYFVDTSGGNVTLTLPNAAMTNGAADVFDIYKVTNDANQMILNADTGDLINFVDQDLTTTDRGAGFHIEEQSGATEGNWIAQRVVTTVTASMLTFSATDRLLGRDTAGAGAGEELAPAAVKTMLAIACADLTDEGGGCSMSTTAGGDLSGTLPSPTVIAASTTQAGKVELATVAEATTGSSESLAVTPLGLTTHSRVRSFYIPAGGMDVSGSCAMAATAVLVTNGPKLPTITCTDNDADSIEFDWVMPDGWDAGAITVELAAFSIGNNNTEVFEMDFAGQCVSSGDTPTAHATTGEQAATITWGNAANREQHATTAAITLQGTCAAGDHVYMRGQVDATASTMTPFTDLKILGVKVEYTRNAND